MYVTVTRSTEKSAEKATSKNPDVNNFHLYLNFVVLHLKLNFFNILFTARHEKFSLIQSN